MVFTKKVTKAPAVMVETKKLSEKDTCGMGHCGKMKHCLVLAFLVINTLLLIWVLCNQTNIEAAKVGGRDNYEMVQKIYKSFFKSVSDYGKNPINYKGKPEQPSYLNKTKGRFSDRKSTRLNSSH